MNNQPASSDDKIEVSSPSELPQPSQPPAPPPPPPNQPPPPAAKPEPAPKQPVQPPPPPPTPSTSPAKIETSDYDAPVKPQPTSFKPTTVPPIKQSGTGKAVAIVTTVAIGFLLVGFLGGFLGFRYVPKFKNLISGTAETNSNSETAAQINNPASTNSQPGEVDSWPIYSNTKYLYSIKYPDTWYNQGANDPTSKTVLFSSYKPDEAGSSSLSGFKVEIVLQDSNGKTLKDWIDANNVTAGNSAQTPKKIQVGGQDAYQQPINGINKNITTYISRTDKIMVVTYYGPENKFDEGKVLYDKMLDSIKLT